jgi:hypothetical protein
MSDQSETVLAGLQYGSLTMRRCAKVRRDLDPQAIVPDSQ